MSGRIFVFLTMVSLSWAVTVQWGEWNRTYSAKTALNGSLTILKYRVEEGSVARVVLSSNQSSASTPLLAVFREKAAIVSLQVPIVLQNQMYHLVGRTLCPFDDVGGPQILSVELSSYSPVRYDFRAFLLEQFKLSTGSARNVSASASEPIYFQYDIPTDTDSVVIHVDSNSSICMTVSIQPIGCPVFDLTNNVISVGAHQTMTKSASITIERRTHPSFYVIFVVKPNDNECSEMFDVIPPEPRKSRLRTKFFTVKVESTSKEAQFVFPIMVMSGSIALIYLAAIVYMVAEVRYEKRFRNELLSTTPDHRNEEYMADDESLRSYDLLEDASDKMVVRAKVNLTVADLSLKTWKQRDKKYSKYTVSLMTLGLFYGLPVVQLVLTWQETVRLSGDLDLCWYNFRCARPLFGFFAFNNIFSNCGYVFLGLLLIIMTKERDMRQKMRVNQHPELEESYGIPQHPGLMYSIGIAVIMEGILSASYHICPSSSNYQFDTSFMYVIGLLGMLKVYQLRHPDINANAHVAFALVAFFIFVAMIGVYFNDLLFWYAFAVFYVITMFFISFEFYFKGRWRFRPLEIKRAIIYAFKSSNRCSCIIPSYKGRFAFLCLANAINIAFIVMGVLYHPRDFASFLLAPFIANLFLYVLYYIVMKCAHGEKLSTRCLTFLLASAISWCISMWFFLHSVSDWSETPAISRERNQQCFVLGFFDNHDIWHFFSSLAIFISFTLMDRIDDDLQYEKRSTIVVF